jgi:hypothetical protein
MDQGDSLIGKQFGRLQIVRECEPKVYGNEKYRQMICKCDCGKITFVVLHALRTGNTQSCGCLQRERTAQAGTRHGFARRGNASIEYRAWCNMLSRCLNPNAAGYAWYGGCGITIAREWIGNFTAFYDYMGPAPTPTHSLDRIDPAGNYEPGNVRWATKREQYANRRNVIQLQIRIAQLQTELETLRNDKE